MNNYVIAPESEIYLIKCPIEMDSLNQIDFATLSAQETYFKSLPKVYMDDATYVRKNGRLYFEGSYDEFIGYNYCMYKNSAFSNKWFYAFISDMRYESNNSLSCDLTTDVFQTWLFDVDIKRSFVERTHISVANDIAGNYTYPEELETGPYMCNTITKVDLGVTWYVFGVTKYPSDSSGSRVWVRGTGLYNGIFSGKRYYAVRTSSDCETFINEYDSSGHGDDISELFIVPAKLIGNPTYDPQDIIYKIPEGVGMEQIESVTITRPTTIHNYTPRNKKLLAYPYQYILIDNNAGNSVTYRYEFFGDPTSCTFNIVGALTPGTSMSILPIQYTNITGNTTASAPNMFNNGLSLGKYPICNWNTDMYINWLTQNSLNMQYNVIQSTVSGVSSGAQSGMQLGFLAGGGLGAAIGGVAGAGLGGLTSNLGSVWENDRAKHEQQFSPNQSKGNANAGDVITSGFANCPFIYKMSVRAEYARVIDDFFDMFGYKLNRVTAVNTKSRSNWNYIKTIDINIIGDVPSADMQKLKSLYNNGFTIWHDPSHYLDYSQTNS